VPCAYYLLGVLSSLVVRPLHKRIGARAGLVRDRLPGSVRLLIIAAVARWIVTEINLPLFERQFWAVATSVFTIFGVVGLLLVLTEFVERKVRARFQAAGLGEKIALLRLARRGVDVLMMAAGGLVMLHYFGVDPTAALAGLGIGGIAVALAAQKTLENVIGGLSLVFDEAVRVGDTIKLAEMVGTVDQVGLRSTRIRTMDRTIVTVPNGQIATASIETLSLRDKFWFRHIMGLRYETTPAQMRAIVDQTRELIVGQPGVETESVRVRFLRLGPSSLDVEMVAYIFATDWGHFLEIQQELLLRVMEIVEAAGSGIAFPSQTLYVSDDRARTLLSRDNASGEARPESAGSERLLERR
jgi:MscS family membrane protein